MNALNRYPMLVSVPAIILLWALASHLGWVGRTILAAPEEVVSRLFAAVQPDATRNAIFLHAWHTVSLALSGWIIALIAGTAIGAVAGTRKIAYLASEPLVEFVRAVPPVLVFPLFLVAFNFGRSAYIWTVVFGCLPVVILSVARGMQMIDRSRLEILTIHKASKAVMSFAGIMEVFPSIFLGARLTFSISLIIAVVTEMVFTPRSGLALGALAKDSEISFDTATFYACIVTIGLYGYICNVILRRVERWLNGGEQLGRLHS